MNVRVNVGPKRQAAEASLLDYRRLPSRRRKIAMKAMEYGKKYGKIGFQKIKDNRRAIAKGVAKGALKGAVGVLPMVLGR